jgi:branched-chain amino acid transport system permease protein
MLHRACGCDIPSSLRDVILLSFLFGGLALAWNIAGGYAGLISFGHAAFFGVGSYTSTFFWCIMASRLSPFGSVGRRRVFGAVLALICARLRGQFFILSTLAFAEVVRIGAELVVAYRRSGRAVDHADAGSGRWYSRRRRHAWLMLGYLVAVYAITKALGRPGSVLLFAIRDNEDAASAAREPAPWTHSGDGLSAALTGVGGSLFAQYFLYLDPTYVISPELSFALLPAVGGLGTAIGPVLGSFLITPLSELLRSISVVPPPGCIW